MFSAEGDYYECANHSNITLLKRICTHSAMLMQTAKAILNPSSQQTRSL